MKAKTEMEELFGRGIKPGDSFLRIESQMGGSALRYYFFAGFAPDGRTYVQEYGGAPRIIKDPSFNQLILLTPELLSLSGLTPPTIDEVITAVTAPKVKKATKANSDKRLKL